MEISKQIGRLISMMTFNIISNIEHKERKTGSNDMHSEAHDGVLELTACSADEPRFK